MRFIAALCCVLLAWLAAPGVDVNVAVGEAVRDASAGNADRPNAALYLSIGGGPTIDFTRSEAIPSAVKWAPLHYEFVATSGTARLAVTKGAGSAPVGRNDVTRGARLWNAGMPNS